MSLSCKNVRKKKTFERRKRPQNLSLVFSLDPYLFYVRPSDFLPVRLRSNGMSSSVSNHDKVIGLSSEQLIRLSYFIYISYLIRYQGHEFYNGNQTNLSMIFIFQNRTKVCYLLLNSLLPLLIVF